MRFGLVLFVAASCGRLGFDAPPTDADVAFPPPPASYVAGTRLRPLVYAGSGAHQLVTWFDQQLDMECELALAEDGVQRCMPTRVRRSFQYADAGCTVPLLGYREPTNLASCPSATTIASFDDGSGKQRGVTLGAPFTGQVYQSNGTTCVMVGGASIDYFEVGTPVAPETFVAAHEIEVRHGSLSYVILETDDGAQELQTNVLRDHVRGDTCELHMPAHDRAMCLVRRSYASLVYADAGCTQRAAVGDAIAGDEIYAYDSGLCEDTVHRYSLGAPITSYYSIQNDTCTPSALPAGWTGYRIDGELPLDPSATAVLQAPTTNDILGEARWVFDNGMELPAGLYDTRHADFCHVIPMMTSFTNVCAPLWTSARSVYTDNTCTTAVAVYPECRGKWRAIWYPSASGEVPCDIGFTNFVHRYSVLQPGPFWRKVGTTCTPVTETTGMAYTMSGTRSPESEFVPVTRQME